MQHQAVLFIQQYTVLQVCQPAVNAIFPVIQHHVRQPSVRGTVQTAHFQWSAEVRHFRPETAEYLHLWRGDKRCDCAAGQSFNLSDLCRFTRKYIRFEHQFGMGILLSHAASIRPCRTCNRATAYECRCGPKPQRVEETTKRDRVRRPATATHLHRMQPG